MTKKYVVTGGTGFIGAALVKRLVADGFHVTVLDNDLRGSRERLKDVEGKIELKIGDVRDCDMVKDATRGADSILHLAALNGTENFYKRPELVLDIGMRGMYAVLQAAAANNIEEVVLASSSEAYQTPPTVPTPENVQLVVPDPWEARYSYGGSKLVSELMLANYHRDIIKRALIFRPHNVYGPDMGWEHVIPQFAVRAKKLADAQKTGTVAFPIQGDGLQTRSFIHIDDFIDALMLVLAKGTHRNIYHLGTEEEVSIRDVVAALFAFIGRDVEIVARPAPSGATQRRCPSIDKIQALGFQHKIPLRDGLANVVPWYFENASRGPAAEAGM